ncbi:hypothetical protein [Secundilactobacillus malefermentans]|uniref:Uncharacterized protein n=1 Tax=Secundilactobacillus malefermentans TaxID=176292 RepID=A0A4V3A409_9LACO|nr:hypothetical protein [Secundilactobacillus malefermentans]KRM57945.1 hypothetical protein FD44_GL000926 [Secundilactobacillus malefermentans DSM 5705 = KCTC 3548]QEA31178.1 hypothetical protein FGL90_02780 [Secundilactobacillus malefermentans]TDG78453.1 hypothetical protein C5L31_001069 [Secundilactobacillus malefermentans]
MISFEKLHPLLTEHYRLDWLTQFKLVDIISLLNPGLANPDPVDAAKLVNEMMSKIMRSQAISWGIQDQTTKSLIGMTTISNFEKSQATIELSLQENVIESFNYAELLDYLFQLLGQHLQITQLIISLETNSSGIIHQLQALPTNKFFIATKSAQLTISSQTHFQA